MDENEIKAQIAVLESKSSLEEEMAWSKLKPLGKAVVPYLRRAYRTMRKASGRRSCVFHSIRYARESEDAFQLGIEALSDRATLVRYRACGLLAYSLRKDALPHLRDALSHEDQRTVDDAKAAIDAIENQNHHFFVDRFHTGRSFWSVNPADTTDQRT